MCLPRSIGLEMQGAAWPWYHIGNIFAQDKRWIKNNLILHLNSSHSQLLPFIDQNFPTYPFNPKALFLLTSIFY